MYQRVQWSNQSMTTVGHAMGLLPDTYNCGLRMRRDCRERFPRYRLQRKLLVSDLGMHHGTCVTHVPWCMSGSLTRRGGENATGILGACATGNFTYLVRGPLARLLHCRIFVRGSTEHRCWIPLAKKTLTIAYIWCFLCCYHVQAVEQTVVLPVIFGFVMLPWRR